MTITFSDELSCRVTDNHDATSDKPGKSPATRAVRARRLANAAPRQSRGSTPF